MTVIVGSDSDGWNRKGYVAVLAGPIVERRPTLAELVAALKQAGVRSSEVQLAEETGHTHAMSEVERIEFWAHWNQES
ncbi:hypothetical protein ACFPN1_12100 [Lysobacter yangpyeongensis]|uniref:Uncharacterized protein n=1 Tax=Lysobacter yangpyeongensis TaxID=346182 RepID=A0ABW0SP12_9GAMM